jgi:hypothetical protein
VRAPAAAQNCITIEDDSGDDDDGDEAGMNCDLFNVASVDFAEGQDVEMLDPDSDSKPAMEIDPEDNVKPAAADSYDKDLLPMM